ncbi:MAG TPA: outer membrane beta-barrel protein [Ignavibacteriales bacterium]|nr:outer membrane beta-barrel protein [Ignavibacteriales bacterium]
MNKALACVLVFLLTGAVQARPQESDSLKSKTAILFNVVSLNLQGYNGGVGFKYWIGQSYALKAGLDFSYNDNRQNNPNNFDEYFNLSKSIGFTVDIERYFPVKDNLQFYFGLGAGPQWSLSREDAYRKSGSNPYKGGYRSTSTSLRANILFGAEYALSKTFALTFQQTLSGTYVFGEQEDFNNEEAIKYEMESFRFDLGSSSLILLIYF